MSHHDRPSRRPRGAEPKAEVCRVHLAVIKEIESGILIEWWSASQDQFSKLSYSPPAGLIRSRTSPSPVQGQGLGARP